MRNKWKVAALASVLALAGTGFVRAEDMKAMTGMTSEQGDTSASLTATLVSKEAKAKKKAATVAVKVKGIELVDPDRVHEKPKAGQGHLHYQVDDGPIVATTSKKLSFHGLTSGTHKITVMLAANDHTPLGPQQVLEVTIP